jgi:PAS domain S-box-containing protein
VLIGFATIIRDITERQKAHSALQDSERHFRLLVSGVTDYALYMLDPEGYVSSWNIGGQRIKGYMPGEIIGQHFSRFYTESDRAANRPARALSVARETGRYEEEGWRVRKDGSFFWASVIIDAIRDDSGTLVGFTKITRDITERRNAQTNLERVQKQLAESQKMDALGQLTGGVAHDFNNLLMIVSGHIHSLKEVAAHNPKAMRAAHAIELAAQRGAALTRQLLTFSRRQRVNPEAIDVRQRLDSIREVLTSGLGGNIGMTFDFAADTWPVVVDVGEFEIALVNLMINARDAMPDGGLATITTKNFVAHKDDSIPAGDYVAISVKDTGVGIPPDVIANVFDPFFTTKPVGKGTGLGLSQVHGFAHQAGGTVTIDSTLGHGTTFTFYLPRAKQGAAATAANELLRPERLWGGEVGAELTSGEAHVGITLFRNRLENAIANVTLGTGPGNFPGVGFVTAGATYAQRQNLDAIDSKGVEVSADAPLGPLTLRASYAFTDARVDASGAAAVLDGLRPAQVAKHSGSLSLRSDDAGPFGGFATLRYVGRQNEDDLGLQQLDDALTLDAGMSWRVSDAVSLEARGENLFDALVPAAISSTGIIERATPRTLWVGARLSF